MAIHARPLPLDPYNPVPSSDDAQQNEVIRLPSPYIPIRLPVFALVIWLNDLIVSSLTVLGGGSKAGHRRNKSSIDGKESIEEGVRLEAYSPPAKPLSPRVDRRKYE